MYIGSWQEYKLAKLISDQSKKAREKEKEELQRPVIVDAARPITR
jgi:hypothetical protein